MGYYINQKCGACKSSLTGGYVGNYSGVGQPFITCAKCGANNDNSSRMTEWKLKSPAGQFFFILSHVLSVIFYYGCGAGLIGIILLGAGAINSMVALIAIILCSLSVGLVSFVFRLSGAIEKSNSRMADATYVSKLKQLGIIRTSTP